MNSAKGESVLIIDIASGSTGVALAYRHPESVPELVASVRTPFYLDNKPSPEALQTAMLGSLKTSFNGILPRLTGTVERALVVFSSPWLTTDLKTVVVADEKGFKANERMLRKIIREEEELFKARLTEMFAEESEIFESALTNLYLNGYEVAGPNNEHVRRAEMSFILSATTKDLLWKIENEIIRAVGVRRGVVLQSFMFAFFKVLSHSYQNLHSALLINMTSEVTDILFLRNGVSAHSASLPFGPASVARSIAAKLNIPLDIALSWLALFAAQEFDEDTTKLIDEALLVVEEEWKKLWRTMGESIPEGRDVPYAVFLVVPKGFEVFVKTFLESVLEGRTIIVLGDTNNFSKELVRIPSNEPLDEKFLILASFSNLLR